MRASLPRVLAMPISMWFSPLFSVARVSMFLEKIKVRKELHNKPWYLKSNMMPSRLDSSRMRLRHSAALSLSLTWRRQSPVVSSKSRTSRKTTLSSLKMQIEIQLSSNRLLEITKRISSKRSEMRKPKKLRQWHREMNRWKDQILS